MARFAGDIEQGALFRYSLIVPALNETFTENARPQHRGDNRDTRSCRPAQV